MDKKTEVLEVTANKIGEVTGFTPEQIAIIKSNVAKGTTDNELAYFVSICKSAELDPLRKEIWCYKDSRGNLLIFAGRDGFLKKAQANPLFNGIRSVEVCENDDVFSINVPSGKVAHTFDPRKDRGKIIGAYAIVFRKDGEPTIEWASSEVYNKGYNTWKTHPAEMIKKVAEVHALKKAFGFSGIQSEYDFKVQSNVAEPIETIETDARIVLEENTKEFDDVVTCLNKKRATLEQIKTKYKLSETIEANLKTFI